MAAIGCRAPAARAVLAVPAIAQQGRTMRFVPPADPAMPAAALASGVFRNLRKA